MDEVAGLEVASPNGGADLIFTWTDATNAEDYVVLEDDSPAGVFDTITGTAPSGLIGLTVPTPPGNRFYIVAGRNSACGLGPK